MTFGIFRDHTRGRPLLAALVVAAGLVLLWPGQAGATSVTLLADARVVSGNPDLNQGGGVLLSVYTQGANVQRTVLMFQIDPGFIPAGAVGVSATLTLYNLNQPGSFWGGNPSNVPMDVYRVTTEWAESQVTWNSAQTGVPWTTPGGDYVGTTGLADVAPYATTDFHSLVDGAAVSWTDPSLGQMVQDWSDGIPNYGMLLRSGEGNHMVFYSEEASASLRPALTVTYSLPLDPDPAVPEPVTMMGLLVCCGAVGGYLRRRSRLV